MSERDNSFIDRIVTELNELEDRLAKLNSFIESDAFKGIEEQDRNLLCYQSSVMGCYVEVLSDRLKRLRG